MQQSNEKIEQPVQDDGMKLDVEFMDPAELNAENLKTKRDGKEV